MWLVGKAALRGPLTGALIPARQPAYPMKRQSFGSVRPKWLRLIRLRHQVHSEHERQSVPQALPGPGSDDPGPGGIRLRAQSNAAANMPGW